MKTYEFTLIIVGMGEDEHEAWEDALEYCIRMSTPTPSKVIDEGDGEA